MRGVTKNNLISLCKKKFKFLLQKIKNVNIQHKNFLKLSVNKTHIF